MEESIIKYNSSYSELSELVEHAGLLSFVLSDLEADSERQSYGSFLFTKLAMHSSSFHSLLPRIPNPEPDTIELWDLSSLAVLLRTIIDNHFAFFYVAVDDVPEAMVTLRLNIWKYHSEFKRLEGLERVGSSRPEMIDLKNKVESFRGSIENDPIFLELPTHMQSKVLSGRLPFLESNSSLSSKCGIDKGYYKSTFDRLSSFAHSMPFSLSQLMQFRTGDGPSIQLLKGIVDQCSSFLAMSIKLFPSAFPKADVERSEEVGQIIEKWSFLLKNFSRVQ